MTVFHIAISRHIEKTEAGLQGLYQTEVCDMNTNTQKTLPLAIFGVYLASHSPLKGLNEVIFTDC